MGDISATQQTWQDIAARKRSQRDTHIPVEWRIDAAKYEGLKSLLHVPRDCGLLSERELKITEQHDAIAIVEKVRDGIYTVEDIITAFCKRAAIVQQVTNCLTEIMFAEAIATAKIMDEDRQRFPTKPLPPLYGLPISLKDGFKIPGYDATIGFVSLVDQPATTYSALPALLKDLGAVFYCKTNVPQTLMSADSHNNVFGRTLNPHNTVMTPGGSSGGEAVLIAMRGSVLGLCTDIAGSVRIPAVCNGVYGFKACASIIPYAGQQSPASPGIPGVLPSIGPVATTSRACAFLLENVMKAEPWRYDGTVLHLPWQNFRPNSSQPLRIGLIEDNTMHTPSPPMRRALRESADTLRRAGHEIVPISLEDFNITQTVDGNWEMYGLDGFQMANKLLSSSGEPVVPSVVKAALLDKPAKNLDEIMSLNFRRLIARSKFSKLWTQHNVDIIMLPPSAHTAVPIDEWYSVSYTSLFNYLDWPATVLPVGTVGSEDVVDEGAKYGARDEHVYKTYTGPEDYAGLPTSIQLVGQPQEDEKLAWYAQVVDRILQSEE